MTHPETAESNATATILLVDDEADNCRILGEMLRREGYETVSAHSGAAALEVVERCAPDAIVLDVMMPMMDGFETCQQLKASARSRNIPVVMVSAMADRGNRLAGMAAGAADFLAKPLDREELFLRVRQAVAEKRVLDRVRREREKLRRAEAERAANLRKIAHDMRSPLLGINGNIELLMMVAGDRLSADEKRHLEDALECAAKLGAQVDALSADAHGAAPRGEAGQS